MAEVLTGEFQEWDLGADWQPYNLAVTVNESIYVLHDDTDPSDGLTGKVFELKRDGTTLEHGPSVQAHFNAIARGPDNTVWMTDSYWDDATGSGNRLWNMLSAEPAAPFARLGYVPIPSHFGLPANPYGIGVDSDGVVWFACQDPEDPAIGRYDPASGRWGRYPLPADSRIGVPVEVAFDGEGDVWFTIRECGAADKAGFGKLEVGNDPYQYFTRVWVDDGGGGVFPAACRDVFGLAASPRTPWEIHFIDESVWYTDKTAACLVQFNPSDGTFTCFSVPTREEDGFDSPWDAHYFDVAADGLFWLAAFGWDAIGTFSPATGVFAHFPLDHGAGPMGIAVDQWTLSWADHAWVVETGTGRVGRFIPLPDSDRDGIPDDIDTASHTPSDAFVVGTRTATIDRGDQQIGCVITRTPEGDGVRVFAGCDGGDLPALVTVPCDPHLVVAEIDPCDSVDVRCGSASVRVQHGPVVATIDHWMEAILPSGVEVRATDDGDGALNITNLSDQQTIAWAYKQQTLVLAPGQSLDVVSGRVDVKAGSGPNP
jgi:streptogramin lyase